MVYVTEGQLARKASLKHGYEPDSNSKPGGFHCTALSIALLEPMLKGEYLSHALNDSSIPLIRQNVLYQSMDWDLDTKYLSSNKIGRPVLCNSYCIINGYRNNFLRGKKTLKTVSHLDLDIL